MEKTNRDPWWVISIWLLGHLLRTVHIAASLFLTWCVMIALWTSSSKDTLAIVTEFCVMVWMVAVSHVAHEQIEFSYDKLLASEIKKAGYDE